MRLFLSRRWLLFAVTVLLLAALCWRLGEWQFDRREARLAENALVERNLDSPAVPVDQVLRVGADAAPEDQWQRVTATGTYDDAATVVVRYQTRDGAAGVDLVTPLRTSEGPWLLVDRGWTPTQNRGGERPEGVTAPTGQVTVTGWVRSNASEDVATVTDGSTRAVSSVAIAPLLEGPVYGGFVDAETESPPAAEPLVATELPELGGGPHFFYGLQWWFFGALAVFGFFYLAYDERRQARRVAAGLPARKPRRRNQPTAQERDLDAGRATVGTSLRRR
ncbi:SURF1 family protein [Nocardioidaceae bacterium]|nr:SURF1 family protein [Nocardioidaceae bacterium]